MASAFGSVLPLLDTPHNSWGEVRLTKRAIKVANLQQGAEAELRHFLESLVLQANSDTTSDTTTRKVTEHEQDTDEQMTATFQAFAHETG